MITSKQPGNFNNTTSSRRTFVIAIWGLSTSFIASAPAQTTGPSSSEPPYLLPVPATVETVSLLTVGDSISSYRLVGIPDGLGAFDNNDGTFTILVNHEISSSSGIARAHGGIGAFVSKWVIDKNTFAVLSGQDQIQQVFLWNTSTLTYDLVPNHALSRFCSGDLPAPSAFFNALSGLGTQEIIYTNGEEVFSDGRAFAHLLTGTDAGKSFELPRCGNFAFENAVASPNAGDTTVLIGLDDVTAGQIYVYVGQKTNTGSDIDKAGLTNGNLFGLVVTGLTFEDLATGLGGPATRSFSLHNFGDVSAWNGATLDSASGSNSVTAFLRPEDGHFDPNNPADFYWVTTGDIGAPGRLWRLRFDDITDPALGGTIELLLDGTEGVTKPDNLTVDQAGHVLIQEDRGSSSDLARVWLYDIATDALTIIAQHDPVFFQTAGPDFLTTNEESSGIIDARSILGPGWYLCDVQAHFSYADPELVQGGQLLALFIPPPDVACPNNCGDIDASAGNVTLVDFATFALCFNRNNPGGACPDPVTFACADLDGNGTTNLVDFATFSLVFGKTSTNAPPNCP